MARKSNNNYKSGNRTSLSSIHCSSNDNSEGNKEIRWPENTHFKARTTIITKHGDSVLKRGRGTGCSILGQQWFDWNKSKIIWRKPRRDRCVEFTQPTHLFYFYLVFHHSLCLLVVQVIVETKHALCIAQWSVVLFKKSKKEKVGGNNQASWFSLCAT